MNPPVVPILLSLVALALAGPLRAEEKFTPFQGNFRDPRNFS